MRRHQPRTELDVKFENSTDLQDNEKFVELLDDSVDRTSSSESTTLIFVDVRLGFVSIETLLFKEDKKEEESVTRSRVLSLRRFSRPDMTPEILLSLLRVRLRSSERERSDRIIAPLF